MLEVYYNINKWIVIFVKKSALTIIKISLNYKDKHLPPWLHGMPSAAKEIALLYAGKHKVNLGRRAQLRNRSFPYYCESY